MNKKSRILSVIMALFLALSVMGCAAGNPATGAATGASGTTAAQVSQPAQSTAALTTAAAATTAAATTTAATTTAVATGETEAPVVIKDHLGRTVNLDKEPEKLVSGYYITSSMLIALGLEDKLVGIEAKANTRPIYSLAAPKLLDLPNVGSAKEFNLEGCVALNPDLVILPVKLKDAVTSLEGLGIKVIAVNPENMDLLKETLTMISQATGTQEEAKELSAYYDQKLAELAGKGASGEAKTVYLSGNSDFLSTATGKMYQNFLIETAGAKNVAAAITDTYWATVSYEQLLAYNPDLIVIVPEATYTKEDILADEKLQSLSAVKNKQIYVMPSAFEAWDSPVPSGILGAMWLKSVLNEKSYPFAEFQDEVVEFYEEFYDFKADKAKITY